LLNVKIEFVHNAHSGTSDKCFVNENVISVFQTLARHLLMPADAAAGFAKATQKTNHVSQ